jgi:hypothetical protein
MAVSKWSDDAFLDTLKAQGDQHADQTVAELDSQGELRAATLIFRQIQFDAPALPADAPAPLKRFWEATQKLPAGVDMDRIARGQAAFMRHVFEIGSLLLTRSLPAGYAAPRLSRTLMLSGDLDTHTWRRVLAVVQLLVEIGGGNGFQDGGSSTVAAQKMRLMHAGVRLIARRRLPEFGAEHPEMGSPVSKEDMLGTLMGFSYLPIDSLRRISSDLPDQDAEDIYYLWQVFGVMMGIHPPRVDPQSEPSFEYIPANLDEAATFYASYGRRNYVTADRNPDGAQLAAADLRMMKQLIPRSLRLLGCGHLPRLLIQEALKPPAMALVGLRAWPAPLYGLLKLVYLDLPILVDRVLHNLTPNRQGYFAGIILRKLVRIGRGGEASFFIPDSVAALKALG